MSEPQRAWAELHDLFETDDGSLPEIRVDFAAPDALVAGYAVLRARAARIVSEAPTFWSIEAEERALDSVPNAAELVVSGDAEPFHVVLGGLDVGGVELPDLGVFVTPDQIALDYRMGPAWGPAQLGALFELLRELVRADPAARLTLEEGVRSEVRARFDAAWRRWTERP